MTTTPGPIQLTTITLYCRTETGKCQKLIETRSLGVCEEGPRMIYRGGRTGRVLCPSWCPLAEKEQT